MMQLEGFRAGHACEVARVSRAGFYRHYEEHQPRQADMELRDAIQRIALANRCYGYRRVTAELSHQGTIVNHKRVLRLMRVDNLLAVRKRRFVFTTDSSHTYAIYPNLAARLTVTGISYGQEAHRRVGTMIALAVLVAPVALFGLFHKTRLHYIGINYAMPDGKSGGILLQGDKDNYRAMLVALQGVTGVPVSVSEKEREFVPVGVKSDTVKAAETAEKK
jgi:hypothetical protein